MRLKGKGKKRSFVVKDETGRETAIQREKKIRNF
jgi:hypothetical protein